MRNCNLPAVKQRHGCMLNVMQHRRQPLLAQRPQAPAPVQAPRQIIACAPKPSCDFGLVHTVCIAMYRLENETICLPGLCIHSCHCIGYQHLIGAAVLVQMKARLR